MVLIRKILFKAVGLKNYIKILHKGFHFIYANNFLKNNVWYKYYYFDKKLIQPGDIVIDIGANLGYYSLLFSKWVGNTGKVISIEPVPYFYETIKWAAKNKTNVQVHNVALGEEDKEVTLATPGNFGYLRTGLAHVLTDEESKNQHEFSFNCRMKKASELFANLPKIDFIKCDIEGYEAIVLTEMKNIIVQHKPILQIETWTPQREIITKLLVDIGYAIFDIEDGKLLPLAKLTKPQIGDLLFVYDVEKIKHLIGN